MFLFEEWFWRGTQSAIFYYVSCTPYRDFKYEKRRKGEATRAQKARDELFVQRDECRPQPVAFETNEGWVEEILAGPGPPKGWPKDPLHKKYARQYEKKDGVYRKVESMQVPQQPAPSTAMTQHIAADTAIDNTPPALTIVTKDIDGIADRQPRSASSNEITERTESVRPSIDIYIDESVHRPPVERRISAAVHEIKNTLKTSLHPTNWNFKRYEREDEILEGFNEAILKLWDKVTGKHDPDEHTSTKNRRKANLPDDRSAAQKQWERGYNPAINDLHPPVVSQLPATREEAHWMLLPPPSAAVMAGKAPPANDLGIRRPLCIIGRTATTFTHSIDDEMAAEGSARQSRSSPRTRCSTDSGARTPPSPQFLHGDEVSFHHGTMLDQGGSDLWDMSVDEFGDGRRRSAPILMSRWSHIPRVPSRAHINDKEGPDYFGDVSMPSPRTLYPGQIGKMKQPTDFGYELNVLNERRKLPV